MDFTNAMLAAIVPNGANDSDAGETSAIKCVLPDVYEQKKYLIESARSMTLIGKKRLCSLLVEQGYRDALVWCIEGTAVNMDKLEDSVIEKLYALAKYTDSANK